MSEVSIVEVKSAYNKKRFIEFPYELHSGNKYWVEPLRFDVKNNLDTKKNPFYKHSRLKLWLAVIEGKVVGRIAGIINDNHNEFHDEKTGFFGFFECVNDRKVSQKLFDMAADFSRKEGMNVLRGPVNPSTNDECGLLVNSFDIPPVMLMPYNPEYYVDLITSYGFSKAMDLIAFDIDRNVIKDEKMMQKLERVADMIMKRENITFRNVDLKDFKNEVQKVREIYNDAWSRNWGL